MFFVAVSIPQAYVDRITGSAWWRRTCPPSWLRDEHRNAVHLDTAQPPRRVIVVAHRGAGGYAHTKTVYRHRGHRGCHRLIYRSSAGYT